MKEPPTIPITGTNNGGDRGRPGLPAGPAPATGWTSPTGWHVRAVLPAESPTAVDCTPPAIPMVRTMGLVVLFALLSAAGLFVLRRRANV